MTPRPGRKAARVQWLIQEAVHDAFVYSGYSDWTTPLSAGKHNYGGEAAGRWMQLQSAYDHLILSTCYEGCINLQSGRIKISHRFNAAGRVDFVELKFLRSTHACLTGEIRKLLTIKGFQTLRKDWLSAEAFVLPVLPRELVFLFEEIFRTPKHELFAWLVNIGRRVAFAEADIRDAEGRLMATATSTLLVLAK